MSNPINVDRAMPSSSQGSTPGRMADASDFCLADSGLNDHPENPQGLFGTVADENFTGFEDPPPKGFRARWKSQAYRDTQSLSAGESSGSQLESQFHGSEFAYMPDAKRPRTMRNNVTETEDEDQQLTAEQLGNISNIARLEAMQRFRTHDIKMPWEKGPLAPVFGGAFPSLPSVKGLVPPRVGLVDTLIPTAMTKQDTPMPIGPVSKFAAKRIAAAKCIVPEDEMLAKCLNQIKSLILLDLQGTEVGVSMSNMAGSLDEASDVLQILKDCFAKKATATVLKRTSSFWALAGWLLETEKATVWELTEKQLYSYMCMLRAESAAPTRASHLVEALNFFDSTLRFRKTSCKGLLSARVQGAAHSMYLEKRKLKQAPQLSVAAVRALEIICTSNTNHLRTAVSGALLFCVFASARWSDFSRLERIWTDRCGELVLVEAETSKHKTAKSKEAKTRLLPFTALGKFCCDEAWGETFVKALDEIKEITGLPFLPSWNDRSGSWAVSPMTTAEASLFLKEFLEPALGVEAVQPFSSHSCKPTVLTWCGMTNILTREERTLLGHHIEASTKSATTYNRDSQLLLQAKVAKVLDMVANDELEPDSSRASRLRKMLRDEDQEGEVEGSAESDFEDTEVPTMHSKLHMGERPSIPLGEPDEYVYVAHKLTGTVHVLQDEETDRLACGRVKTINMDQVEPNALDAATAPFCIQCNAVVTHTHG